jgi:hypothetical protein
MGYLSNTELTVDAILTKAGRAKLASGQQLSGLITKFALSDDEIDYTLYEPDHPNGTAYYDYAIKNIPVLEASPDQTQCMKYKLFTSDANLTSIPQLSTGGSSTITYSLTFGITTTQASSVYTPATSGITEVYTFVLANSSYGQLIPGGAEAAVLVSGAQSTGQVILQGVPQIAKGTTVSFTPTNGLQVGTYTTTLAITGNTSGATATIPITITVSAA